MLKGLKNKKEGKADTKKDTKKDKEPKADTKKKQDEEEETNDALVDINYEEKEKTTAKNVKKGQASKLEEKQIDTSNFKVEKKEEKKQIKSWVVEEKDIKNMMTKDFDMTKHETDFVSLTNQEINKQLEEKAKKEAIENVNKPKVEQINGFKYAPLQKDRVDVNDSNLVIRKPERVDVNGSLNPQISGISVNPPVFTNSKANDFKALEKTPQQLREEQIERKMQQQGTGLTMKGKSAWLGSKTQEQAPQQPEMKVSGWASKANEEGVAPAKFAPLERTAQEKRYERQEQDFVYVSKKDMQERRKKREAEEAAKKPL